MPSKSADWELARQAEIAEGDRQVSEALTGRMDQLSARMDGFEEDIAALERDFNARVEELETAVRFDAPIYFGFDEDEVTPQYMAFLDRFAQVVHR